MKQIDIFSNLSGYCNTKKDSEKSGMESVEDRLLRIYREKKTKVIEKISEIGLPRKEEQFRLLTKRSFNSVEFLQFIAEKEVVEKVNLAVYSINFAAAIEILRLINEGRIKKMSVMMSNLRNKGHREKEQIIKTKFTDNKQIELFYCCSHAKVMTTKTANDNYYCIEGSGNLTNSSRVEQYVIDNSKEIFDFSESWMKDIKEFLIEKKIKELEVC